MSLYETTVTEDGVGLVETEYFTFAQPPGELLLDSGEKLGPITVAYETYGEPNDEGSNAVLIPHARSPGTRMPRGSMPAMRSPAGGTR
jgi:homoserine acetyltransferase